MKKRMCGSLFFCAGALSFALSMVPVSAESEYTVILNGTELAVGDGDFLGAVNPLIFEFAVSKKVLPTDAVLLFQAFGSQHNFNEVYVNPRSLDQIFCDDDGQATDMWDAYSVGYVDEHDANDNAVDEWWTNLKTFESTRLQPSLPCSSHSDCTVSAFCDFFTRGIPQCKNRLMFCSRSESGRVSSGNQDDFRLRHIVLYYQKP